MHRKILAFSALFGAFLSLAGCLTHPSDTGSSSAELHCTTQERAFNGACRATCTKNSDCAPSTSCMVVAPNETLCLDYTGCAFLGSDTQCSPVDGDGYGYTSYSYYGSSGCVGNATWQVSPAVGDPKCGAAHTVGRCRPVGQGCEIVVGAVIDIADK